MEIKLTGEQAAKLSGKTAEELQSLLFDEEGTLKEGYEVDFMNLVTEKFKKISKGQYNRGIKEKGTAIEKALRSLFESYEVSDFETTEEAIEQLQQKLKESTPTGEESNLDIEKIRKHPAFQEALDTAIATNKQHFESQLTDFQNKLTAYEQKERNSRLIDFTFKALGDKAKYQGEGADAQRDSVTRFLKAYDLLDSVQFDEKGNPFLADENGDPRRDSNMNPINYENYVKENWLWGFNEVDPNKKFPKSGKKGGDSDLVITSSDDFNKKMDSAMTAEERSNIRQAYTAFLEQSE